jgi:hypothetical protein
MQRFRACVEAAVRGCFQPRITLKCLDPNPSVPVAVNALANTEDIEAISGNRVHHMNEENLTLTGSLCNVHKRVKWLIDLRWPYGHGRLVGAVAANQNIELVNGPHNGVAGALLAIGNGLESSGGPLPKHAHIWHEPDWLKILKLCVKLAILAFKLRQLNRKCRKLAGENRDLLLQKVNHILAKASLNGDANNVFGDVGEAHKSNPI